jgi:DNA-binding MarR family transcriptional regulator
MEETIGTTASEQAGPAREPAGPASEPASEPCSSDEHLDGRQREALDLWADLLRVTNTIHARVTEDLVGGADISPEEVELLMRLSRAPEERLRMVEVSRSLLLSKSGVTRLVDRLEQRGLVERASCAEDRRVVYTRLTEPGRRALGEASPLLVAAVAEHLGRHLDVQEIARMRQALGAVLAAEGGTPAK